MQAASSDLRVPVRKWSARLRHPEVEISKATATRREKAAMGDWNYVCVMSEPLPPRSSFAIRVLSRRYGMLVGIGLDKPIQAHNFRDWHWPSKGGHGLYVLESDGLLFCHTLDQNCDRGFGFSAGDVLSFEFDSPSGFLQIGRGDHKIRVKFDAGPSYRACVYMYDVGDAVELQPLEPLEPRPATH